MSKEVTVRQEFKKHVAAIHTSGELSLLERKLVNVLLLNAYDNLLDQKVHTISVPLLCEMLGWTESNNIRHLKKALSRIVLTSIEFNMLGEKSEKWSFGTLMAHAEIHKGICTYEYSVNLAQRMADPDVYAIINLSVQRQFKGSYSLNLYENCLRYKRIGSTGWIDTPVFRKLIGADAAMYDQFKHLSNYVIQSAVKEVNEVSDLTITYEFKRENRKVTAIKFLIEEKQQKSLFNKTNSDEIEAAKKSVAYQRFREHNIGERLAIVWAMQGETRANEVIDHVETLYKEDKVKSTAGYIRKLIEDPDIDLGKSQFQKKLLAEKKVKQEAALAKKTVAVKKELESERRANAVTHMINAMSVEEKRLMANTYISQAGIKHAKSYNEENAGFKNTLERVAFIGWLRMEISKTME